MTPGGWSSLQPALKAALRQVMLEWRSLAAMGDIASPEILAWLASLRQDRTNLEDASDLPVAQTFEDRSGPSRPS